MKTSGYLLLSFVLAACLGIALAYVNHSDHKYAVLSEVAQLRAQGMNEQEIIMNAKSPRCSSELRTALDLTSLKGVAQ